VRLGQDSSGKFKMCHVMVNSVGGTLPEVKTDLSKLGQVRPG
jgi:hypothetical protein